MRTLHLMTLVAMAGALAAQNNELGFVRGWNTTFTDRIGGNAVSCDALNHYDDRIYTDFMLDPADPTGATYKFLGCRLITQDQVGNTPETFSVVAYNESATTANTPGTVWFRTGAISLPASTLTTPVAWIWTITFNPPSIPKSDVFLGLSLNTPASGNWPADGLSTHCAFSGPTGDRPGPGSSTINNGNLACFMPTTAGVPVPPAVFPPSGGGGLREIFFEVSAAVSGGVCVTQTNQTSYPSSNAGAAGSTPLGGTTNFLSGNHPDIYDGNASTPARADDIGFLFTDASLPSMPVFLLLALGPSPVGSIPLTSLAPAVAHPNTRGNVCIDFVQSATFLGISNASGVIQQMLVLSPATRTIIQGLSPMTIWYQAFGLNANTTGPLEVHASGCGVQHT